MKNLMKIGLFAMLGLLVITTGCNDDPDDPIITKPSATLDVGADYEDQTFEPGRFLGPITVTFKAGDVDLNGVYVYKNGTLMSRSDFTVDGDTKSANPFNLTADQKSEVTFEFAIQLSEEETTETFDFSIADVDGEMATVSLDITTELQGTPIEEFTAYLMWNADGQQNGGLNLHADNPEDASVSANSGSADIIDSGINIDNPVPENWKQTIEPANGAKLMPFDGDYDEVVVKEQLSELYDASATVTVSGKVHEGDLFIVEKDNKYFLLKTVHVEATPDDNNDYYEFSIKR